MKTTTIKHTPCFADLPRDYRGLCMAYLPRPIHSAREYAMAEAVAETMAGWEERMSSDQKDYFDVLTDFMADYDDQHRPYSPHVSGWETLRGLVEENSLSAADVARILGAERTLGSKILRGERRITADHARKLGGYFKLEPGAFL